MRNKFSVGDQVTTKNPKSRTYGYTGTVTESCSWGDVVVHFDHLKAPATFDCDNLELSGLSKIVNRYKPNEEQKRSLVYVYFHDCEEQPENIEEAFVEYGLDESNFVFYDTVNDVLNSSVVTEEVHNYANNLFLIVDGKLVLVEKKIILTPTTV